MGRFLRCSGLLFLHSLSSYYLISDEFVVDEWLKLLLWVEVEHDDESGDQLQTGKGNRIFFGALH